MRIHSHYFFLPRIPHHAQRMPSRSDLAVEGTRQVRRCAGYRYSKRSCRAGHMHARTKRMALFENPVLATNAEGTRQDQCSIGVYRHVHGKFDAIWLTSNLCLRTPYNPYTTTSLIGQRSICRLRIRMALFLCRGPNILYRMSSVFRRHRTPATHARKDSCFLHQKRIG